MRTTAKERQDVIERLLRIGVSYEDANALRRISMTLQRWYELECGDSNAYGAWAIERDEVTEVPYMVRHHYSHTPGTKDRMTRTRIADKEKGALKRLQAIAAKYKRKYVPYVQTDPRGAALFMVAKKDIPKGGSIDSYYSRGVAVY